MNPNEAPEGYRAEALQEAGSCKGCDFIHSLECLEVPCTNDRRADGCDVILKRTSPVMAIYATPCDDMGAHV